MAWKVFGIVSSLGLIIAGFVAKLVFQETEISKALIVFGVFSLVMDMCVIAIVTRRKNKQAKTQAASRSISTLDSLNA
ncbi:hypothetical protein LJC22_06035 [Desulfosarcina sp. OttesenSCG-928-G10]|nr:hypothetical protein [Desulfosarcina sp. OttesenSCG-928-G10]MDL2322066.1 hypothetical protein [Desulfosarcina sp. OttesenSCG-928-B08]